MSRLASQNNKPDPVDIHVGAKIRTQRMMLGMSQTALAERIGVTFQQLQKYEKAANRVSSSRLQNIADALNVPVSHFFDSPGGGALPKADADLEQYLSSPEGIALNRAFARLSDTTVRRQLVGLIRAIAAEE
ncbi:helix-turn-helix domain-containing protein (plasmid) [Ensifer sp. D2-11]